MKHALLAGLALAVSLSVAIPSSAADAAADRSGVGIEIRSFALKDHRGRKVSLAKHTEGKVTVVAFIGTECPLVQLYGMRLTDLAKEYESKDVAFLAIDSNHQDTKPELVRFVSSMGITFPVLRDVKNMVADHFGATRTPEVFVLDRQHVVRYRGRIDDQYGIHQGVSFKRPKPERRDLAMAIDEVLADKPVTVPKTDFMGCLIGRAPEPKPDAGVNYSEHVAAIFNRHCVECHRPGEVAPFSMVKYEDFEGWGDMIREVVAEERMPPWHADPKHGQFSNDSRLTDSDKKLILDWVDAGCPPGDLSKAPTPPKFAKGWQLSERKQVFYMNKDKKPFKVPAEGEIEYKYFTVDPGFTEDKWVQAAEARAGNRAVVHHIIVFIEPPGEKKNAISFDGFLVATAPGARPMVLPDGYAKRIPKGSKLKFQMHYTPNGRETEDLSSVGLVYVDPATVKTVVRTEAAMNIIFKIPPGADDYPVDALRTFRQDTQLVSLYPHMHLRGKAFRYTARYPDGKQEILLDVPHYDFNWQNSYELAEPKLLPKGTELRCEALFDNSKSNPSNPNPDKPVTFGEQTSDEMMIGFADVAVPREADTAGRVVDKPRARKTSGDSSTSRERRKPNSAAALPRPAGAANR
ncbi:MAG: thioredoxin family protein [Pirellulales bacterium]|nr:thioredoxin family protein [Pirellulales bacterium]